MLCVWQGFHRGLLNQTKECLRPERRATVMCRIPEAIPITCHQVGFALIRNGGLSLGMFSKRSKQLIRYGFADNCSAACFSAHAEKPQHKARPLCLVSVLPFLQTEQWSNAEIKRWLADTGRLAAVTSHSPFGGGFQFHTHHRILLSLSTLGSCMLTSRKNINFTKITMQQIGHSHTESWDTGTLKKLAVNVTMLD